MKGSFFRFHVGFGRVSVPHARLDFPKDLAAPEFVEGLSWYPVAASLAFLPLRGPEYLFFTW